MVVVVLTLCPVGLRGHLTQWLMEVAPGVFVGTVTARVREHLWERVVELCKDGRALLVYQSHNEQGLAVQTHHHDWEPVDVDGVTLMLRPGRTTSRGGRRQGWSKASKYRRYGRGGRWEGDAG
ncbi:MAG TPA: type I-E CRISPR-associated endoribonuclease Cas2e [Candidatus Stackebrandtia excrementipullorum]|nr:type I-E CRISPR-associated endoribonuclease Cas2e [Candidatus Stackebrandtia excrementipullorum]